MPGRKLWPCYSPPVVIFVFLGPMLTPKSLKKKMKSKIAKHPWKESYFLKDLLKYQLCAHIHSLRKPLQYPGKVVITWGGDILGQSTRKSPLSPWCAFVGLHKAPHLHCLSSLSSLTPTLVFSLTPAHILVSLIIHAYSC